MQAILSRLAILPVFSYLAAAQPQHTYQLMCQATRHKKISIRAYQPAKDKQSLLRVIEAEGEEWSGYLEPPYQKALEQSITYVAYAGEVLCGYIRSISDAGCYIWVVDLLVYKPYRGALIGQKLLTSMAADYPGQDVFVMSDADGYYEKLGYSKVGSIFKLS